MHVDLFQCSYSYLDTLNLTCMKAPNQAVQLLNWWLSTVMDQPYSLAHIPSCFKPVQQTDSFSYGPAVMSMMLHIALNTLCWQQDTSYVHCMNWFLKLIKQEKTTEVGLISCIFSHCMLTAC